MFSKLRCDCSGRLHKHSRASHRRCMSIKNLIPVIILAVSVAAAKTDELAEAFRSPAEEIKPCRIKLNII